MAFRTRINLAASAGVPPSYRTNSHTGGPAGTTTPTITLPSDIQAGDFLILTWASYYAPGGDPTGWTRDLLTTATGGPGPAGVGAWHKTATSGDAGASVTIPVGVGSDYWTAAVVAYQSTSGARSITTSTSSSGTTSYSTPTSTATSGDVVVSVWLMEAGTSGNLPNFHLDAAVTERVRVDWGGVINQASHVGIGDEAATGGTTTARTASWSNASSWAALTYVLMP